MMMTQTMTFTWLFTLMLIVICSSAGTQVMKLSVNEETPVDHVVANIREFVNVHFYDVTQYEVTAINKFFAISTKKDVLIKKVIDLEKICEEGWCCSTEICVIKFVVHINSQSSKYVFDIEIEIKDINDNKPNFKTPVQSLSIPENSIKETAIRIDGGFDNDVTLNNKIQYYKFIEPTNTFRLDHADLESLSIILQQSVDFETKNTYRAELSACELNTCTNQTIIINIEDENDNFPKFQKSKYEIRIKEDFPVNSMILQVRAIDLDGPKYNKTKYKFVNKPDRTSKRFFAVSTDSGMIFLKTKLSASLIPTFRFKILVEDAEKSGIGKIDFTDVVIDVIDINDHNPRIQFVESPKVFETGRTLKIYIKENEPAQKLLSMQVSDADLGDNGKVTCQLKDNSLPLDLKYSHPGLYEILSVREFDYEREKMIRTIFDCVDGGRPQLSEYRTIEIIIEDVNEFTPEFMNVEYYANLTENMEPEYQVLQVQATDQDKSANLTYSIEESVSNYFTIDSHSGIIKTGMKSFDKEEIDYKIFHVSVSDDRSHPKTAQARVKIDIRDENDNDPVFVPSSLQFYVLENQPSKTTLHGKLVANDKDKSADNSFVSFHLVSVYDSNLVRNDELLFRIKVSGDVETARELDRESNSNYTLTVKAQDRGSPSRSTMANATVHVRDINDNAPQWIQPRQTSNYQPNFNGYTIPMLNISETSDRPKLIMQIKAVDVDESDAGKVTYTLNNHQDDMFTLNETTGELMTVSAPLRNGQYRLQLRATDHGNPSLHSDAWILVNVIDNGKLANINLTIIIGMIAITVLISIFLIVAIICVRRRPRFQKYLPPSAEIPAENQYFSQNHWIYHSEETPAPPLSDNESYVFLPQNYCSSNHPDCPPNQTIIGSRPGSRLEYPLALPSSNNFNTIDITNVPQMTQNIERMNGTLRSNNGFYGSSMPTSMGVMLTAHELDGDSADSGKGASEVDLRLQHQLIGNRNYTTMPFPHYSTATTSFGHFNNLAPNQYYSINTNPRSMDSRFLTVNTSHLQAGRRVASPSNSNCKCFILPEDDVIQVNQDNEFSMSTFSKSKLSNHETNCIYNNDEMSPNGGGHFYADYPYGESSANMKEYGMLESKEVLGETQDVDKSYNNLTDNNHNNKNLFTNEKNHPEKNFYAIGLAN